MKIDDAEKYEKMATNRITKENHWLQSNCNIEYYQFQNQNLNSKRQKNKLSKRVSKTVEIDETEIALCRSERNWTKLDEIFYSILFITVAFW